MGHSIFRYIRGVENYESMWTTDAATVADDAETDQPKARQLDKCNLARTATDSTLSSYQLESRLR